MLPYFWPCLGASVALWGWCLWSMTGETTLSLHTPQKEIKFRTGHGVAAAAAVTAVAVVTPVAALTGIGMGACSLFAWIASRFSS